MKKILTLFILFTLYTLLSSHEFWLQPDKFIYNYADIVNVNFMVGENFDGSNWSGNNEKIQSLYFYYGDVKDNLSDGLSEEKGDSLVFRLCHEGTAMLAFNSVNSYIEIDAPKFNEYLAEDGLNNAISYRNEHNETDSMGREYYQRSVKTIIQAGGKKDNTYKQETDLPVDIIPLQNPYALKTGDSLAVKILFKKIPLTNYKVRLWHKNSGDLSALNLMSNNKGEIKFALTTAGRWMVSTVTMEPAENDDKADWQSYWGSCTWGYE
jgi:uncharacterized GH25 family protein